MNRKLIIFLFLALAITLPVLTAAGQEITPTFDPFASGSFYTDRTPTATPDLPEKKQNTEGMVLIPEGSFLMGSDSDDGLMDSKPAHKVSLNGFWIDIYEVTNEQFAKCVESHFCYEPRDFSSATRKDYYTNKAYANYPVIHVDWNQANAYCSWVGKRLPTEAEWEKAARGENGNLYPWGNELPNEIPAQINRFEDGDTVPVDSFPEGVSPYGVYNMEGNVWEWTADRYDEYYYSKSPAENPKSASAGNDYVIRGYSWAYPFSRYEITTRNFYYGFNHTYDLGFRCAMDAY